MLVTVVSNRLVCVVNYINLCGRNVCWICLYKGIKRDVTRWNLGPYEHNHQELRVGKESHGRSDIVSCESGLRRFAINQEISSLQFGIAFQERLFVAGVIVRMHTRTYLFPLRQGSPNFFT